MPAGRRLAFHDLPEPSWAPAVRQIIAVVIRPDAVLGCGEDLSPQNIKAKTDQHIQPFFADALDRVEREAVHKAFSDWSN